MKKLLPVFFGCLLLVCSGCTTSTLSWTPAQKGEKSSSGKEVLWHLEGVNNGIYLFYYIPVVCGRTSRPNRGDYQFFRHWVNEKHALRLLHSKLIPLKAQSVEDITVKYRASGWAGLGIFWSRSFMARGKAVKKSGK